MTAAELQFHWMRLGNRPNVAKLFGFSKDRMATLLPETDQQRYMRGQMVNLGGILAKRCVVCMTARELDRYYADEDRASGCRAVCDICREKAGVVTQRKPAKRTLNGSL